MEFYRHFKLVSICTTSWNTKNPAFCPHSVLKLSIVTAIKLILLHKIHGLIFRMKAWYVLCEVWSKCLYIMFINFCLQGITRLYCPMITCFWDSALWNGWKIRRFGETYCLHLQSKWNDYAWTNSVTLKNEGSKFLYDAGTCTHCTGHTTKKKSLFDQQLLSETEKKILCTLLCLTWLPRVQIASTSLRLSFPHSQQNLQSLAPSTPPAFPPNLSHTCDCILLTRPEDNSDTSRTKSDVRFSSRSFVPKGPTKPDVPCSYFVIFLSLSLPSPPPAPKAQTGWSTLDSFPRLPTYSLYSCSCTPYLEAESSIRNLSACHFFATRK